MTPPTAGPHTHGPLAEEAAKLAEALSGWASAGFSQPLMEGAGESSECRLCPVCQLLRVAQGARPEVFEHLADASASLMAALRAAIESSQASWSAGGHSAGSAGSRPASERIDIR
ncbi:MAG TPA: DUF5304 family protein [Frankiaceae bacterium]|jgi:hypothetical protein|nr:DUF5304 family protein [Frankiaceae bacterium]